MRHIKSVKEGEIIMDTLGGKVKVLGRLGSLIFRSEFNRYEISAYRPMTWMEAEKDGWKVLNSQGKETMTKKEVENLLGNVEII